MAEDEVRPDRRPLTQMPGQGENGPAIADDGASFGARLRMTLLLALLSWGLLAFLVFLITRLAA